MGISIVCSGILFMVILILIKIAHGFKKNQIVRFILFFCVFLILFAISIIWSGYYDAIYKLHSGCCY